MEKPIIRSSLRRKLGREFYILKRKWDWISSKTLWAKTNSNIVFQNEVFHHKSFILRPLKDVDMYLQENKRTNLKIAISKLDGLVINQNEIFSLWKLVGRPTKAKGYLEGLVLNQGKIDKGTGGGLCQLGNLLFWIFAHSPLSVVERYRHGFDVFPDINRKVPFGAGATLSYNYIDLQVRNTTNNEFQLKLWIEEDYLHGRLYSKEPITDSYEIFEREHKMDQQYWGGYSRHNKIFQVITKESGEKEERLLAVNDAIMMYNPFLESK